MKESYFPVQNHNECSWNVIASSLYTMWNWSAQGPPEISLFTPQAHRTMPTNTLFLVQADFPSSDCYFDESCAVLAQQNNTQYSVKSQLLNVRQKQPGWYALCISIIQPTGPTSTGFSGRVIANASLGFYYIAIAMHWRCLSRTIDRPQKGLHNGYQGCTVALRRFTAFTAFFSSVPCTHREERHCWHSFILFIIAHSNLEFCQFHSP